MPACWLAGSNNMFAKSFLALEGNGGLSDALTAPYDRYTCKCAAISVAIYIAPLKRKNHAGR
ncbi:TPA: hypothetical protein MIP50_24395 [Klebsiella pneumoniae]|nr:hypothetical protein [Klebsiella pneumoniae]